MEVVGEPDLRSPEEPPIPDETTHDSAIHRGIPANMEEGSFRCDANISIRPEGTDKLLIKLK